MRPQSFKAHHMVKIDPIVGIDSCIFKGINYAFIDFYQFH